VGTGKTLIVAKITQRIYSSFLLQLYIPNPYLTQAELRRSVASELQVS